MLLGGGGEGAKAGVVGQAPAQSGDGLQGEHVPVAGMAEALGDGAKLLAEAGLRLDRQRVAEQIHSRAQATQRDAHLVDAFRVVAGQRAGLVRLELRDAGAGDRLERRLDRRPGLELDGYPLDGGRRRAGEQGIAAAMLAPVLDAERHGVEQPGGEIEQLGRLARLQFELRLADRQPPLAGADFADVDGKFDLAAILEAQRPGGAGHVGLEHRHQLGVAIEPGHRRRGAEFAQSRRIGAIIGDLGLPFIARAEAGDGAVAGFQGL